MKKRSSLWDQLNTNNKVEAPKNVEILPNGNAKILFEASKFIIFQSTICASVCLESASNFLIKSIANDYINSNGEGWSNESLQNNYKSFIGANACLDHPENPDNDNVGVILDAALRRRWLNKDEGVFVYYVDILVAIDKQAKNGELSKLIVNNSIQYMSMGCDVDYSFCSRCGHVVDYANSSSYQQLECDHLKYSKGRKFLDSKGIERITAELLGKEPGSVTFIEASVLSNVPAFKGAALSRIYPMISNSKYIEIEMPKNTLDKPAVKKYLL